SGGARLQKGMLALVQKGKNTAAGTAPRAQGLLFVSGFSNPHFGGAPGPFSAPAGGFFAAPPRAQGFGAAPRVAGATAVRIPEDARRAEDLLKHGLIDIVVPRSELRQILALLLSTVKPRRTYEFPKIKDTRVSRSETPLDPVRVLALARHPDRPRSRDYIER